MPTEIESSRTSPTLRTEPSDRRASNSRVSADFVEELLRIPASPTQFRPSGSLSESTNTSLSSPEDDSESERFDRDSNSAPAESQGYTPPAQQVQYLDQQTAVKHKPARAGESREDSLHRAASDRNAKSKGNDTGSPTIATASNAQSPSAVAVSAQELGNETGQALDRDATALELTAGQSLIEDAGTTLELQLENPSHAAGKDEGGKTDAVNTLSDAFKSRTEEVDSPIARSAVQRQPKDSEPAMETREASRTRRRSDRTSGRVRGDQSNEPEARADSNATSRGSESRGATRVASLERISSQAEGSSPLHTAAQPTNPTASGVSPTIPASQGASPAIVASSTSQSASSSGPVGARLANSTSTVSDVSTAGMNANPSTVASNTMTDKYTRAESTSGGSPNTSLTRYQESKLVQRVLKGLEQLSNGSEQVRMRLHPPELGTLQLTLRIEGTHVSAQMNVESSNARDALLKNLQVLKDRLSDQGMQIDRFDVQIDPQASASGFEQGLADSNRDSRSRQDQAAGRHALKDGNRIAPATPAKAEDLSRLWTRTNGELDVKV